MLAALKRRKVRGWIIQVLFVGGLAALLVFFAATAQRSMDEQGMTSGFGFLLRSTGWPISFSLIPYGFGDPYWKAIAVGILNTLFLASISLVLASLIGLVVAVLRTAPHPVMNFLGTLYVDTFRNIPIILQVFFWYAVYTHLPHPRQAHDLGGVAFLSARGLYIPGLNVTAASAAIGMLLLLVAAGVALWISYGRRFARRELSERRAMARTAVALGVTGLAVALWAGRMPGEPLISVPSLQGLNFKGGISLSPELAAMITAIAIYGGAYLAEIFRAGFLAVRRGQIEAAESLGLSRWDVFSSVRLPLAIRAILPTLINQYVWLLKATTLGIAIGFADFFMVIAVSITQSGQTIELIGILMGGFLAINFTLSSVLNWVNRSIALRGQNIN